MTYQQSDIGAKGDLGSAQVFVPSYCGFAASEAYASLNDVFGD
jgi:hypothetical protein